MLAKGFWLCSLLAIGLLAWSGLCMVWPSAGLQDGGALIVENSEQELGEQTLGSHTLELRVRNTSSQPRRILGMTGH